MHTRVIRAVVDASKAVGCSLNKVKYYTLTALCELRDAGKDSESTVSFATRLPLLLKYSHCRDVTGLLEDVPLFRFNSASSGLLSRCCQLLCPIPWSYRLPRESECDAKEERRGGGLGGGRRWSLLLRALKGVGESASVAAPLANIFVRYEQQKWVVEGVSKDELKSDYKKKKKTHSKPFWRPSYHQFGHKLPKEWERRTGPGKLI